MHSVVKPHDLSKALIEAQNKINYVNFLLELNPNIFNFMKI